ncbi:MAG: ImpA family metalloprotease [Gammaproteobacteria bacterium]
MTRLLHIASFVIGLSLISGCGGDSSSPDKAVDSSTPSSTAAPASQAPQNQAPTLAGTVPSGKENEIYRFRPTVLDADNDTVTLSIISLPSWLVFDAATEELSGTPTVEHIGLQEIELLASDGKTETKLTFAITVDFDEIEQAIRTGDPSFLTHDTKIVEHVLAAIESDAERYANTKNTLFALSAEGTASPQSLDNISWDPTQDSALLNARFGRNEAILTTNSVTNRSYSIQQHALAIVGESDRARYAVFGGNPVRDEFRSKSSVSDDMSSLTLNVVNWLTQEAHTESAPLQVVLAQLDESFRFPDQSAMRSWLDRTFTGVRYNAATQCNTNNLSTCITHDTDLLIVSQKLFDDQDATVIANQVQTAMQNGTPVLYLHHDGNLGELGEKLLPLFEVDYHGDNYWRNLSIENYSASASSATLPADVSMIQSLVNQLGSQNFSFNLSDCEDKACPDTNAYRDEFLGPVETLQGQLRDYDQKGVDLFSQEGYRYQKLLVLLGDFYRQQVSFPMDRNITPTIRFLRSLFADHTVYYQRRVNPAQPDMGNFSRSDFSHIRPTTRNVSIAGKAPFRSTGAYALPGVTFQVTRQDQSGVNTHVFINTLRPTATHEFDEFGYTRPKYTRSSGFDIEPGQTLTLTSPHGGPIQIGFDDDSNLDGNADVELTFENVGEHPYWSSSSDNKKFAQAMETGRYDWAELVTPGFEVHSTLDKMRTTLSSTLWKTAADISAATSQYTYNYPHQLAGLTGPGIDTEPEVLEFAHENGLSIDDLDVIKHMNADQASCGFGCSGNPYDASWSFDPLGHGDLHELGHGLENSRFRFSGWEAHASTNIYSYYSKHRYYAETGNAAILGGCQNLPFEELFNAAQASAGTSDPVQSMQDASLNGWAHGVAIYLQLMMRAESDGALDSGWNLMPRLHIVTREFDRADDSEQNWLEKRDGLGFAGMARTDARRLSNNDWLLIVLSHVTGRDLRDYLQMWGLNHSDVAATQVKALNLPSLPVAIHALDANGYCLGLNHKSFPVDGRQVWPIRN